MSTTAASHQSSLKRELGLWDVALTQVVYVVGVTWVGVAARLGNQQLPFWLAAMLLFYLPQAAVVIHLSRAMPLEGGLYQWAKIGLADVFGFMVAWNLWMYAIVLLSTIGLVIATNLSYAVGASSEWIAGNKYFIAGANALVIGALAGVAVVGLRMAKWVHNAGSIALMLAFALLIGLPFVQSARGAIAPYHPFKIAGPALTLFSLNIFGKLSMGALSGFEYVAVMAGECRDPRRTIAGGTLISAPIIAVMFVLGTSSMLAYVSPDKINMIGPVPQVLRLGFGSAGAGAIIAPIAILLITARTIANSSILFTATSRLPLVAGWDNLVPQWFARLDPRRATPVNSIVFVAAVSMVFALAGMIGTKEQEAFQLLENAAGILYGLTYLVMFAIPVVALRSAGIATPMWLRIASACGFLVTLLYVVLSVLPVIDVPSWQKFAVKISAVVIACNLLGYAIYRRGRKTEP